MGRPGAINIPPGWITNLPGRNTKYYIYPPSRRISNSIPPRRISNLPVRIYILFTMSYICFRTFYINFMKLAKKFSFWKKKANRSFFLLTWHQMGTNQKSSIYGTCSNPHNSPVMIKQVVNCVSAVTCGTIYRNMHLMTIFWANEQMSTQYSSSFRISLPHQTNKHILCIFYMYMSFKLKQTSVSNTTKYNIANLD